MIPVCEPTLEGNELKYVEDCMRSNWISSMGKYIQIFEEAFAKFCRAEYAISCCNGTVALHLALVSMGIGPGDEVIVPSFTMVATANAVKYTGAKPIFVDSERNTWNMDILGIERKISRKTRAIIPVHTYGHPVDMDPLLEIARRHGLLVLEDAAEAHGAEYKGHRVGSLGNMAAFSFYANKIITTGEGGMLVTDDIRLAEKARLLKNHAFTKNRFFHEEVGFNYRMTNIQAAIGFAQMEYAERLVRSRIENAALYSSLLGGVTGITTPPCAPWAKNVYWMYGILVEDDFGIGKEDLMKELEKRGIQTRSFFYPMHLQPVYKTKESLPVSEELFRKGLYLPSASNLTKEQIEKVVKAIKEVHDER